MKRKLLLIVLALCCVFCLVFAACGGNGDDNAEVPDQGWTLERAYTTAKELGYAGTLEEFLETIKGADGKDGVNGKDGKDGENGVDGKDGENGIGIEDVFVDENGHLIILLSNGQAINVGKITAEEAVSIKSAYINDDGVLIITLTDGTEYKCGKVVGENGKDGADGQDGENGKDGVGVTSVYINLDGELIAIFSNGEQVTLGRVRGDRGLDGANGKDGVGVDKVEITEEGELKITLTNGNEINLGNIRGRDGADGKDGKDGKDGANGLDGVSVIKAELTEYGALEITLSNGAVINLGNIKGQDGANGKDGADGDSVMGARINENGELELNFTSGKTLTVGNVVGKDGKDGENGKDGANGVNGADGKDGKDGENGKDGVGVLKVELNEFGELIITLTNGTAINLGNIKGQDGENGKDGAAGANGQNGQDGADGVGIFRVYFNSEGEMIIAYTDGNEVNLGKIPTCVHSYTEWSEVLAPTCTSIGYSTRECLKCGNIEYDFAEETGHSFSEIIYNQSIHTYICQTCSLYIQQAHIFDETGACKVCQYSLDYTDGLIYSLNSDGNSYSVVGIGTASGDIIVPATHHNLPVTAIGFQAFYGCTNFKSITFGSNVTTIGREAFYSCTNLTNVIIPPNVTSIGLGAFLGCHGLESITVPFIGETKNGTQNTHFSYIFGTQSLSAWCAVPASLKSVVVTDVSSIGEDAFFVCANITSVTIPYGVTSIGKEAFFGCTSLETINIPDSVTYIGEYAFIDCQNLTNISLADGITFIGDNAFNGTGITSLTIPAGVTSIGNSTFARCANLSGITFHANVKSIGNSAFSHCGMESVTIPAGVTSIGDSAFTGCKNLTYISIPESVTSIGRNAFSSCGNLTRIYFNAINCQDFADWGNDVFQKSGSDAEGLTLYIGKSVKKIPANFFNCESSSVSSRANYLTEVVFEDNSVCETVGYRAFYYAHSLAVINFPDSVKRIEEYAFRYCYSLVNLTLGSGLNYIGNYAFEKIGVTSITIPENVSSGGLNPFMYCENLETVYWNAINCDRGLVYGCDSLKNVIFGDSVWGIPDSAFYVSDSINNIVISNSVKSIGDSAFGHCTNLKSITIPQSVTHIGERAFINCYRLVEVYDLTNLGIQKDSYGLHALDIYNSLDEVSKIKTQADYVFYEDNDTVYMLGYDGDATKLILPDKFGGKNYDIYQYAFYRSYLTSITVPSCVKTIGLAAFEGCGALKNVYYGGTEEQWSNIIIEVRNTELTDGSIYYYSEEYPYSDEVTEGNFWHYDETTGEIAVWTKEN